MRYNKPGFHDCGMKNLKKMTSLKRAENVEPVWLHERHTVYKGHRKNSGSLHGESRLWMPLFAQTEAHSPPEIDSASTGLITISTVAFLLIISYGIPRLDMKK